MSRGQHAPSKKGGEFCGNVGVPEGYEGTASVSFKLAAVDPASDRVSGIRGPPQDHGGTPVVLKQGPIFAHKAGVRALQDLPSALRPQGPNEELSQEAHEFVALVWLRRQHKLASASPQVDIRKAYMTAGALPAKLILHQLQDQRGSCTTAVGDTNHCHQAQLPYNTFWDFLHT